MEKIERTNAPGWLKEKEEEWGKDWEVKYTETKRSSDFKWRRYKKKGEDDLREALSEMTQAHCSFCDVSPMGGVLDPTIDHFKPKTLFPLDAYKWENLFLSCRVCQKRGNRFDEQLLKPDEDNYSFDNYFEINWDTGKLMPNRDACHEDQERARMTIKLFQLNIPGKPKDRLKELKAYRKRENEDIDEFRYRFFLRRDSDKFLRTRWSENEKRI